MLEYKGTHRAGNEDTAETANIRARLAEVSGGAVIFWLAENANRTIFSERPDPTISQR